MIPTIAFYLLLLTAVIQIIFILSKKTEKDIFSHYPALIASFLLFFHIIQRSIIIKFVAVTNTFESLVFFSATIALLVFLYDFFYKTKKIKIISFGATFIAIVLLAIASSPIAPDKINPPVPALQSSWLVLHVTFAFIGEAFFTVSFIAALVYLFMKNENTKKEVERIVYTTIAIGYPIYTAGALIFGAIWAQKAWSIWWSWDPKEVWALITWLTYTAYLHTRFITKVNKKFSILLAILGYLFTLFTFFGVNYLLSGLHSYR